MVFRGISKDFELKNEEQYNTIGQFWDEMAAVYGLEKLQGLGYNWNGQNMSYAIGFKNGNIPHFDFCMVLPDDGWITAVGETERLKDLYDEIYKKGPLRYEIETFKNDGSCAVRYIRREKHGH